MQEVSSVAMSSFPRFHSAFSAVLRKRKDKTEGAFLRAELRSAEGRKLISERVDFVLD